MRFKDLKRRIKDPRFLMTVMMGAQVVGEMAKKALSDGKLTVGEVCDIAKGAAEVSGLSGVVIWCKEDERSV